MIESDYDSFCEIVMGFAELKGKSLSPAAIKLYWGAMQKWPIEDFRKAAEHLLQNCEFMPMPKDFEDLRKAGRATAGEAWARAVLNCGSCHSAQGYTSGGTCGDEFVDRVVRAIGGYKTIAMCDEDKLHFLERRFAEHFATMIEAADVRSEVPEIAYSTDSALSGPQHIENLIGRLGRDEWK